MYMKLLVVDFLIKFVSLTLHHLKKILFQICWNQLKFELRRGFMKYLDHKICGYVPQIIYAILTIRRKVL